MKRKTALFLAGICLVSLLSGCGSKESAENTDIKDPAPALTREEADSEEPNAQPENDSSNPVSYTHLTLPTNSLV